MTGGSMPFSALSPDGPISILGADITTVENMRRRNREEACFTAKCCGAPLVIRTAQGKLPHFVHKTVPDSCAGERGESPEHRRLKAVIAKEAESTYEWDVETEAIGRDAETQKVLWRADVLAAKNKSAVAFEVQLSQADFDDMRRRQARYKASGVRGLWFVRTKKGFPASKELPIFAVETDRNGDWVSLATAWDRPEMWRYADGAESMELSEFVRSALDGNLKWAPFEGVGDTWLQGCVDYDHIGECPGCKRTIVRHRAVRARVSSEDGYPQFMFGGFNEYRRNSEWHMPIVNAVWNSVRTKVDKTYRSSNGNCCWCSAPLKEAPFQMFGNKWGALTAPLQLKDLPKPKFGSVEREWLRRWTVVDR
ncbi:hypothetical protein FN976_24420 [Caenimonas sedimenti]|uniref:Competence protein CoiA nuclease-like domain-containing protein n=1 Tax=Caenimonas sedimenti TaxID=2596921 RepID=A0A562ZIR0_9BURK|nr:competence protein CoiA family protein [Caenimonas sedimenti]TWO68084.1 hypothetical protein FN976_24420 [Caenimonas sedimenti]